MSKIKDACYAVGGLGSIYLACILYELLEKKDSIRVDDLAKTVGVCVVGGIVAAKGLYGLTKGKGGKGE